MTTLTPPGGWIKLFRCIQKSPMWQERPFDRAHAWIDLLLLANSKTGTIRRRGIKITVRRGEVGHSLRELGERWGWSLGKVQRFLHELKTDTQIDTRTDTENVNVTALIHLVNYNKYQSSDTKNDTKNDTETGTKTGTEQEGKEVKEKPIPKNSDFTLFRNWWMYAFSLVEEDRYIFETGKDGKCLSSMLKTADWKEIVCKACHYLVDVDRFPKGRPTLSGLKSSINRYPGNINGKAEDFRELGILPPDGLLLEVWQPWNDEPCHRA